MLCHRYNPKQGSSSFLNTTMSKTGKGDSCDALQLKGHLLSCQSFWDNIYTADTLWHAVVDL